MKTDLTNISAVLSVWQFQQRQRQLAFEKRKAALIRTVQRIREMQAAKKDHKFN